MTPTGTKQADKPQYPVEKEVEVNDSHAGTARAGHRQMAMDFTGQKPSHVPSDLMTKRAINLFKFFAEGGKQTEDTTYVEGYGVMNVTIRVDSNTEFGPPDPFDKRFIEYIVGVMHDQHKDTGVMPKKLNIRVSDYMRKMTANRAGYDYKKLRGTIQRLQNTTVTTHSSFENDILPEYEETFNWVQRTKITTAKRHKSDGTVKRYMHSIELELCDWLHRAIEEDPEIIMIAPESLRITSKLLYNVYGRMLLSDPGLDIMKIHMDDLIAFAGSNWSERRLKYQFREAIKTYQKNSEGLPGAGMSMPGFAIYSYNARQPHQSVDWSKRVHRQNQYFVFVRGKPEQDRLDVHLDDIPDFVAKAGFDHVKYIVGDRLDENRKEV